MQEVNLAFLKMSWYCHFVDLGRGIPCLSQKKPLQAESYHGHLQQLGRRKYAQLVFVMLVPKWQQGCVGFKASQLSSCGLYLMAWCGCVPWGALLHFLLLCPAPSSNCVSVTLRMKGSKSYSQNKTVTVLSMVWALWGTQHTSNTFSSISARMAAQTGISNILCYWSDHVWFLELICWQRRWQFSGRHITLQSRTEGGCEIVPVTFLKLSYP